MATGRPDELEVDQSEWPCASITSSSKLTAPEPKMASITFAAFVNWESRDSNSSQNHSPPLLSSSDVLVNSPDLFQEWADVDGLDGSHLSTQLTSFSNWLSLTESDDRLKARKAAALTNCTAFVGLGMPCASDDELGLATSLLSTALNNLTRVTPQLLKS